MVVRDRRASAWLLPLLSPVLSSAAGKRMPGRDQGVRVVREPHAGPRRGVMRCAGRSAAARPGTRSCAQPPLVDNPKLLLICPRIYLVLPLRPDVSRSNVLLRSSVILHVEMGTCARGPGAGMGGSLHAAATWLPAGVSFGLGGRGAAQSSGVPVTHAGWQGQGRRLSRSSDVIDRACRARPTARPDRPDVSR